MLTIIAAKLKGGRRNNGRTFVSATDSTLALFEMQRATGTNARNDMSIARADVSLAKRVGPVAAMLERREFILLLFLVLWSEPFLKKSSRQVLPAQSEGDR